MRAQNVVITGIQGRQPTKLDSRSITVYYALFIVALNQIYEGHSVRDWSYGVELVGFHLAQNVKHHKK